MKSFAKAITISFFGVFITLLLIFNIKNPVPILDSIRSILPENNGNHSLAPVNSNQWYSSIYLPLPSQPLYAFPLAFRLKEKGIGFSYPKINPTPNAIHAPYDEDFTIGLDTEFTQQSLLRVSDWSITAQLKDSANKNIKFTLAHGIPFTTIKSSHAGLSLTSRQPFISYLNNNDEANLGQTIIEKPSLAPNLVLSTKDHYYLIAFSKGTTFINIENQKITTDSKEIYIALLPNRNSYDEFKDNAFVEIDSTSAKHQITNDRIITTYSFTTSNKKPIPVTLLPHQTDFLTHNLTPLSTYSSLRGDLTLAKINYFTTSIPLHLPDTTFTPLKNPPSKFLEQLKFDTQETLIQKPPESKDYYLGTYLGKVSTLIQLTESHGLYSEGNKLRKFLKPVLLENLIHFRYDKNKTSLIAEKSEFGNDELNDHHFHYGYYIRTASILSQNDNEYHQKINPVISEMVNDIATTSRNNTRYPYLRNFDIYEGHSWASGYANFGDGNNQESSSEALNAWYALSLWADVTNDNELKNFALYLFNTELISTKYYWFNMHGAYTTPYSHQIASIVWGGKIDFTTWFSPQTNMIYGIQLLPFTPASLYLQDITPFDKYEEDYLKNNGNYQSAWGDLMLMWKSLSHPAISEEYLNRSSALQNDNLQSLYLYYIYRNLQQQM